MVFYAPEPVAADPAQLEPTPKPVEPPALGRLILDIAPATAQIFVDGYYVGVPEDFSAGRGGGLLAAGPHHIDISADRHEPVAVDLDDLRRPLSDISSCSDGLSPAGGSAADDVLSDSWVLYG